MPLSWSTVITVGGVGAVYLYVRGYSWSDIAYASRAALAAAVETLQQGLETLGVALETAKRELSYKLGLIDDKLDATKDSLERQISREVGDVRRDVATVGSDVRALSRSQDKVHGMVESIETQIDSLEGKMEAANSQLSTANRGIFLLCNVVADNMKGGAATARQSGASLYDELVSFTRSAASVFGRAGAPPAPPGGNQAPVVVANVPQILPPSPDSGLKIIEQRQAIVRQGSASQGSARSLVDEVLGTSATFKLPGSAGPGTPGRTNQAQRD